MNVKRILAGMLCFVLVFGSIGLENVALAQEEAATVEAEQTPESTIEPTAEPTAIPTPEPTAVPTPEPTAVPTPVDLMAAAVSDQPSETEVATGELLQSTEKPLTDSTMDPVSDKSVAPVPALEESAQLVHNASKNLPSIKVGTKSLSMMRTMSAFDMFVDGQDYINLVASPGGQLTWTVYASGSAGLVLYAYDVYKDNAIYSFMPDYGYDASYSFWPTEPGSYYVKVFAYDYYSGVELIQNHWFGVSTLSVTGIECNSYSTVTGDMLTWTVVSEGATGAMSYSYSLEWSDAGVEWWLVESTPNYVQDSRFNYRVSSLGYYRLRAYVQETDVSWYVHKALSGNTFIDMGHPILEVYGVSPDAYLPWIGDEVVWTVYTNNNAYGTIECEFTFYYGDYRLYSTGWLDQTSYALTVARSGNYRAEVSVRDSERLDELFQIKSLTVDVSDLWIESITASKTTAYLGDIVTWMINAEGGSGYVRYDCELYLDGNYYDWDWSDDGNFSFVLTEPGEYILYANVSDEFVSLSDKSGITTALERPAPVLSEIFSVSSTSLKATWGAVTGATGYVLERATSAAGSFTAVYIGTATTYTNTGLTAGLAYYYRVRATKAVNGVIYNGLNSAPKAGVPLAGPVISKTEALSASSIKITWSGAAGSTGYELWRSTSSSGTYARVYYGTALAFTDTGRIAGTAYYYKVRAYKTIGTVKYYSPYGAAKVGVALAKPATPTAVASIKSVTVSWAAVTGASGNELWRSTSAVGTYIRVYRGTAKTFKNISLTTGITYYYKVRAYKLVGITSYYSLYSSYKAIKPL